VVSRERERVEREESGGAEEADEAAAVVALIVCGRRVSGELLNTENRLALSLCLDVICARGMEGKTAWTVAVDAGAEAEEEGRRGGEVFFGNLFVA
jgi:hypothetical protein